MTSRYFDKITKERFSAQPKIYVDFNYMMVKIERREDEPKCNWLKDTKR